MVEKKTSPQSVTEVNTAFNTTERRSTLESCACPACVRPVRDAAREVYGRYSLFACAACGLQFWEPRQMPDASWYEQMYGGRDQANMPLEPGHRYFLSDPLAPRGGDLLDIGCGTGNFGVTAQRAGYRVTGIELDRAAARFAKEQMGIKEIFPLSVGDFVRQSGGKRFDIVTFFEVLEHQTEPVEFLQKVESKSLPEAARNSGAECAKPRAG